jgi:alcohol dehydrogenase class IV
LYGGIAITNSGTGGVHALAYPLGGKYHISHGLSNAVLLADIMEFNAQAVPEKFVKVAEVMGLETATGSPKQTVQSALDAIRGLVHDVRIVIEGFEVTDQVIHDLAQSAMTVQRLLQNNPRAIMLEDARKIYQTSLKRGNE